MFVMHAPLPHWGHHPIKGPNFASAALLPPVSRFKYISCLRKISLQFLFLLFLLPKAFSLVFRCWDLHALSTFPFNPLLHLGSTAHAPLFQEAGPDKKIWKRLHCQMPVNSITYFFLSPLQNWTWITSFSFQIFLSLSIQMTRTLSSPECSSQSCLQASLSSLVILGPHPGFLSLFFFMGNKMISPTPPANYHSIGLGFKYTRVMFLHT